MKRTIMASWVLLAGLAVGSWASVASADGVLLTPNHLSKTNRVSLQTGITRARATDPTAFQRVAAARELAMRLDARKRGPYATVTPYLTRLGKSALFPMLEALAFDAPPQGNMTPGAWMALRVGLLEAVGPLGDARAVPVLTAVLDGPALEPEVMQAAAQALGQIGTDQAASKLVALSVQAGPKQIPVLKGMGDCRRWVVAEHLANWLGRKPAPELADVLVRSLGRVGNDWAWKAIGGPEEDATRSIAAQALVDAFVNYDGDVRTTATKAVLLVNHSSTFYLIGEARARAQTDEQRAALDYLEQRFARNPIQ